MEKSVEKTVALLRKSYAGRLTAEEQAEVDRLLSDKDMQQLYTTIGDDEYLIQEFRRYSSWLPMSGYQAFRKKKRQQKIQRFTARLSVAASLLIALGCIWLLVEQEKPEKPIDIAETRVEPGSFRAFLQLSSGERIALEDTHPLDLCESEGTIQIDSGRLFIPLISYPPRKRKLIIFYQCRGEENIAYF